MGYMSYYLKFESLHHIDSMWPRVRLNIITQYKSIGVLSRMLFSGGQFLESPGNFAGP